MEKLTKNAIKQMVEKAGNKVRKLLPKSIIAAAMLSCVSLHAESKNTNTANTKPATAVVKEEVTPVKGNWQNYKSQSTNTLKDLYYFKSKSMTEKDVRNKLAKILADDVSNNMRISRAYQQMELDTFQKSGMTAEEFEYIKETRGTKTPDLQNIVVANSLMQHDNHVVFTTFAMDDLHANEAEINNADEHDHINEFLVFSTKGERNTSAEQEAILKAWNQDIVAYIGYNADVHGRDGEAAKTEFVKTMNSLRAKIIASMQTDANWDAIMEDVEKAINMLPGAMFGNQDMRRDVVNKHAFVYMYNELTTRLEKEGYNVKDVVAGDYIRATQTKFDNINAGINATNKHVDVSSGVDFKTTFNDNFALAYGGEITQQFGINGGNTATQIKGVVKPTITNKRNQFILQTGVGAQFDKNGASLVLEPGFSYLRQVKDDFSFGGGIKLSYVAQRDLLDLKLDLFKARFKVGNLNIVCSAGIGYTFDLNKNNSSTVNPGPIVDPDPENPQPEPEPENPDPEQPDPENPQPEPETPEPEPEKPEIGTDVEVDIEHIGDSTEEDNTTHGFDFSQFDPIDENETNKSTKDDQFKPFDFSQF